MSQGAALPSSWRRTRPWLVAAVMVLLVWLMAATIAPLRPSGVTDASRIAKALRWAPIDGAGLRLLAEDAREKGRAADAAALARLGGRAGWRDSRTQMLLLEDALRREDFRAAFRHADALLRRKPDHGGPMLRMFHIAASEEAGRRAVLERLMVAPPWRKAFFQDMSLLAPEDWAGHESIVQALAARGSIDLREEVVPFVRHLVAQGDYGHARNLWMATAGLPPALLLDGDFAQAASRRTTGGLSPFEWQIGKVANAEVGQADDNSGMTGLRIRTGGNAFGPLLAQRVLLAPGRYTLSVEASRPGPLKSGTLNWALTCMPSGRRLSPPMIPAGQPETGRLAWRITIPETGCLLQQLALQARRMANAGAVDIVLDHARIEPVGGGG